MALLRLCCAAFVSILAFNFAHAETGKASFYGGGRTASGEVTMPNGYTRSDDLKFCSSMTLFGGVSPDPEFRVSFCIPPNPSGISVDGRF
jgi:hypothetical protein